MHLKNVFKHWGERKGEKDCIITKDRQAWKINVILHIIMHILTQKIHLEVSCQSAEILDEWMQLGCLFWQRCPRKCSNVVMILYAICRMPVYFFFAGIYRTAQDISKQRRQCRVTDSFPPEATYSGIDLSCHPPCVTFFHYWYLVLFLIYHG